MIETGNPFQGNTLNKLKEFLRASGLEYDDNIQFSVIFTDDDGNIMATGSLQNNILKCLAVSPVCRGQGLMEKVYTILAEKRFRGGDRQMYVYTKPENRSIFRSMGFYTIGETDDVLFMENRKEGVRHFTEGFKKPLPGQKAGAIICHCDPFTLGHKYLVEKAASLREIVYVFVISEDRGMFDADTRIRLVRENLAEFPNVCVYPTGPYLISSATFPTYFLKDKNKTEEIHCELDLKIFREWFAGPLGITARFVGTETFDRVTRLYNQRLKEYLTPYGIEVIEIPRLRMNGQPVSASAVRCLLRQNRIEEAEKLVPAVTGEYIREAFQKKVWEEKYGGME